MSLRLVSLLAVRMGSLMLTVTSGSFRQTSRDAKNWAGLGNLQRVPDHRCTPKPRREVFEDEPEDMMDDVEDRIQAMYSEVRKTQKKAKFHKTRRQMEHKGAPERKLSWDAMEQIRYLKQEQPEEWSVERLAEGFSVSPDVIFRVLRSKLQLSPERRARQDAKVQARLQQQSLPASVKHGQGRLPVPSPVTAPMLPAGGATTRALVSVASWSLMPEDDGTRAPPTGAGTPALQPTRAGTFALQPTRAGTAASLPTRAGTPAPQPTRAGTPASLPNRAGTPASLPNRAGTLASLPNRAGTLASLPNRAGTLAALPTRAAALAALSNQARARSPVQASLSNPSIAEEDTTVDDEFEAEDEEDCWDGYVFTEERLEELMPVIKPSSPVTQKGNEFFDTDGVLLYRI